MGKTISVCSFAVAALSLLLLTGCDTTDDGTDFADTSGGYSAPSADSNTYEPSVSPDSSSDSYASSQAQSDRDAADQARADAEAQQEHDYQQTQSDLNEADQYHYNNDD
ncbi:MAG: hypothetical protein ABI377_03780 [Devosia sp.]